MNIKLISRIYTSFSRLNCCDRFKSAEVDVYWPKPMFTLYDSAASHL